MKIGDVSSSEGFWAAGKQFFRRNPGGFQGKIAPSRGQKTRRLGMLTIFKQALDSIRRSITRAGPYALKQNRAIFLAREENLSERAADIRDDWFEKYPLLKSAYNLKEDFYRMYDCKSRSDAEYYYRCWKSSIPKELPGFKRICRTVERSYDEIFNYFDAPYTNAFVEGLNSVIRAIAQQGHGYDFEVLRGKVLLGVGRKRVYPKTNFGAISFMTFDRFRLRDFGIPFANIIAEIGSVLLSSEELKQP